MTAIEKVLELEQELFKELKSLSGKEHSLIKKAFDVIRKGATE